MIVNLAFISHCIDSLAQQGRIAAEIHCSAATHKRFVATMIANDCAEGPYKPSLRLRLMFWQRHPAMWKFRGIPLVANCLVPDLGILIRPIHLLGVENWMEVALEEQRQMAIEHQVATMPMPQLPAGTVPAGSEVTANSFVSPTIKTPTDILVDAATNCDNVQRVIVISVSGDSEIKIISNASRFEVFGLLQAATSRVAQGE